MKSAQKKEGQRAEVIKLKVRTVGQKRMSKHTGVYYLCALSKKLLWQFLTDRYSNIELDRFFSHSSFHSSFQKKTPN